MQLATPIQPPHGHDFSQAEWAENDLILAAEQLTEMTQAPKSASVIQTLRAQRVKMGDLIERLSTCFPS